ncbi:hypothetical protein SAMN05421853_104264 [Roseivivax halotolerans]|jgi:hypothetical protein|uniref:DUF1150 family protein n=1 Tax=Roseivivax halotolerans TaxID=93684 RepID=A0A1I5Y0Q5_9RHOB|nr:MULTISPECIES: DUF1150 family protein [Roseivivax]QFT62190.1 hypothetical protein FIU91_04545 [Roseivivax sp. THAF30]SFQ37724.1 hypothetical protein SAMN05421853_104264 [Roseivivax halotolerans]
MNTEFDFSKIDEGRTVYVRSVEIADLPEDVREQVSGSGTIYAVHRADGERLALVKDRHMAFVLARQNDYAPVTVH